MRTVTRASQLLSDKLQSLSLRETGRNVLNEYLVPVFYHVPLVSWSSYMAVVEVWSTGSSLRRPSSEAEYFLRSNTSISFSDDSKKKTRADH